MRLIIDTSRVHTFTVGLEPAPKKDQNGVQRVDRATNAPMWTVQLVAVDDGGAEVINVTTVGTEPPKVKAGDVVTPVDLQAIPWAQNGRNGTAYRATQVKPVNVSKSASTQTASS